jgi:hypothetical protein
MELRGATGATDNARILLGLIGSPAFSSFRTAAAELPTFVIPPVISQLQPPTPICGESEMMQFHIISP